MVVKVKSKEKSRQEAFARPRSVIIDFVGDATVARLVQFSKQEDGIRESGGSVAAFRNPTDKYDAYEGARIALARLFDKDPFPKKKEAEKKEPDFKVGDIVRLSDKGFFAVLCRGQVGKIVDRSFFDSFEIKVKAKDGRVCLQSVPAELADKHLTLVYREEKENG